MIPIPEYEWIVLIIMEREKFFGGIKNVLGMNPGTLSRILKKLQNKGYVEKITNERTTEYRVTDKGREWIFFLMCKWYRQSMILSKRMNILVSIFPEKYKPELMKKFDDIEKAYELELTRGEKLAEKKGISSIRSEKMRRKLIKEFEEKKKKGRMTEKDIISFKKRIGQLKKDLDINE